jgi:hypothetical protein
LGTWAFGLLKLELVKITGRKRAPWYWARGAEKRRVVEKKLRRAKKRGPMDISMLP